MKYFTRERYVALQDFSSDTAMDAADARACVRDKEMRELLDQYFDAQRREVSRYDRPR